MFRAVTTIAKVDDGISLAQLRELVVARPTLPIMGNRVAEEDDVNLAIGVRNLVAVLKKAIKPPIIHTPNACRRIHRHLLVHPHIRPRHIGRIAIDRGGELAIRKRIVHIRLKCRVPNLIANLRGVQAIGEVLGREEPVGSQELVVEVNPEGLFSVTELLNLLVHNLIAPTASVIRVASARENRRKTHECLGLLSVNLLQNGTYAEDGIHGRLFLKWEVPRIVRANHQKDGFRFITIKFAIIKAPKDMFRTIRRSAQVEHTIIALAEVGFKDVLAIAFPEMRNRVANEDDLRATIGDDIHLLGVAFHLPAIRVAIPRRGRDRTNCSPCRRTRKRRRNARYP